MALNFEEASVLRRRLEAALHSAHLDWIVAHAGERVALGKVVQKDIRTGILTWESGEISRRPRRRRTSEFLASEPFDEIEKLEILLEAVKAGLLSPPRMQEQMFANL